jgi:hypothetical protein
MALFYIILVGDKQQWRQYGLKSKKKYHNYVSAFVDRNTAKAYSDPQRAAHIGRTQSESNHHSNAHQQSHAHAHSAQQSRQRQPKAGNNRIS